MSGDYMETFTKRLNKIINIKNIRQVDIVKATGINKGALSSYISGKYIAAQKNLYLLAKYFDVSEAWLMGLDVPMERKNSNNKINDELQEKIESLNNDQKKAIINIIDNMK